MSHQSPELEDQRNTDGETPRGPESAESSEGRNAVRSRLWNVLNSWDKGIDNSSERIGDAMTAGFKTFFKSLFAGKPGKSPRHSDQYRQSL